jgi:hypothetical protein
MAHDQEVEGSNPDTIYWKDVSVASYYIIAKYGNKNSQMGHTNKKNSKFIYLWIDGCLSEAGLVNLEDLGDSVQLVLRQLRGRLRTHRVLGLRGRGCHGG